MRVFSIITLGILVVVLSASGPVIGGVGGGQGYGNFGDAGYFAYPRYQYNYGINDRITGDFKTAHEHREGHITKGSYSVLQPDGILRTVNYIVDPIGGFQANVLNKGVAFHAPVYGKGAQGGGYGYGGYGGRGYYG